MENRLVTRATRGRPHISTSTRYVMSHEAHLIIIMIITPGNIYLIIIPSNLSRLYFIEYSLKLENTSKHFLAIMTLKHLPCSSELIHDAHMYYTL